MAQIPAFFGGGNAESVVVKAVFDDRGVRQGSQRFRTEIKKLSGGMEVVKKSVRDVDGSTRQLSQTIQRQKPEFQMWSLSFMFAGMQIQRVSQMIARSTVDTFMKITQGQTDAGRAITGLAANFKFLQFEIGNAIGTALRPLMPILTSLIRGVASFVNQHPEATFAAIAAAFTLGAGLFLGGQMVLFANGVTELGKNIGGLAGLKGAFGFLANPVLLAVLGSIIALSSISWKAFSETPEAWNAMKDTLSVISKEFSVSIKEPIEDMIQEIFPKFKLNWENVAWTMAWTFKNLSFFIIGAIRSWGVFVNAILAGVKAFKALNAARKGNFVEAASLGVEAIGGITDATSRFADVDMLGDAINNMKLGPMGYKNKFLAENAGGGFTPATAQDTGAAMSGGTININQMVVQTSSTPNIGGIMSEIMRST